MHIKVSKGGGTCINLPKAFCEELNIRPGDEINCSIKEGKIVLDPLNNVRTFLISRTGDDELKLFTKLNHVISFKADEVFCNLFEKMKPYEDNKGYHGDFYLLQITRPFFNANDITKIPF